MVISYDNLWKLLIDKKMNKTDLKDQAGITYNIIARLGKGESVSMESLYKICSCLHCNIGDIIDSTSSTRRTKANSRQDRRNAAVHKTTDKKDRLTTPGAV